jgi:hypothetical protein
MMHNNKDNAHMKVAIKRVRLKALEIEGIYEHHKTSLIHFIV